MSLLEDWLAIQREIKQVDEEIGTLNNPRTLAWLFLLRGDTWGKYEAALKYRQTLEGEANQIKKAINDQREHERKTFRSIGTVLSKAPKRDNLKSADEALAILSRMEGFERLTAKQQQAMQLRLQGMTPTQIGSEMGIDRTTATKHIEVAQDKLQKYRSNQRPSRISGNSAEDDMIDTIDHSTVHDSLEELREAELGRNY